MLSLEKQIDDLKKEHGYEKENFLKDMQENSKKFEDQINQMKTEIDQLKIDSRTKLVDM